MHACRLLLLLLPLSLCLQDLYVTHLSHKTSVIREQLENGMYMMKRVSFFLKKIATSKKICALELNKFSDHELEKKERLSKDRMHLHVNAYQQVQHVCTQMAFFELKVSRQRERDSEAEW